LFAANTDYDRLLEEIESNGTNISSLRRVWLNRLGSVKDPSSGWHYSLMEFVDSGIIARSEMPKEIR
jgi:hypothetical protein